MPSSNRWKTVYQYLCAACIVCFGSYDTISSAVGQVSAGGLASAVSGPTFMTEGSLTLSTLRMIGALCFCLGVFALGLRVARRFTGTAALPRRRRIEVREKAALSSKAGLFLIAIDNREYLVATCPNSISVTPTHSITTPLFAESLDEICQDSGELHVS